LRRLVAGTVLRWLQNKGNRRDSARDPDVTRKGCPPQRDVDNQPELEAVGRSSADSAIALDQTASVEQTAS
jgi:hypothetical protein